jgi:hypothetical protein
MHLARQPVSRSLLMVATTPTQRVTAVRTLGSMALAFRHPPTAPLEGGCSLRPLQHRSGLCCRAASSQLHSSCIRYHPQPPEVHPTPFPRCSK